MGHDPSSPVISIQRTELPEALICLLSQHRSGAAQLERAATSKKEMGRHQPPGGTSLFSLVLGVWESKHCHISPT